MVISIYIFIVHTYSKALTGQGRERERGVKFTRGRERDVIHIRGRERERERCNLQ